MASDAPRLAEMFPTLDDAQIERMRAVGRERAVQAGEILFEQGEVSTKFFVVLEGSIEVVHPDWAGEHAITVHERGGFTGVMNMLAGTRSLVLGRARTAGRVLEIDRAPTRRRRSSAVISRSRAPPRAWCAIAGRTASNSAPATRWSAGSS